MAVDQEFRDQLNVFMGEMRAFRREANGRLDRGDARMVSMEKTIAEKSTCPFHEGLAASVQSNGEKIGELEKSDAVQEVKLGKAEKTQLNLTTIGAVLSLLYQGAKILLAPWVALP
jgi:hypothetical protein